LKRTIEAPVTVVTTTITTVMAAANLMGQLQGLALNDPAYSQHAHIPHQTQVGIHLIGLPMIIATRVRCDTHDPPATVRAVSMRYFEISQRSERRETENMTVSEIAPQHPGSVTTLLDFSAAARTHLQAPVHELPASMELV